MKIRKEGKVEQMSDIDGRNFKWKTKDGQVLRIGQITTQHLQNIIKFLERNLAASEEAVSEGWGYIPRGEIASLIVERNLECADSRNDYVRHKLLPWLRGQQKKNIRKEVS